MLFLFIKLVWSFEIISGRTMSILSCSTFEIILFIKVLRLIGLRSVNEMTFSFLAIKSTFVWDTNFGSSCPHKKHH